MKLYDNYAESDELVLLFTLIRDAFDHNREEFEGVEEDVIIRYVMEKSHGRFNPAKVKMELERFKR